ncbi:MAG TPA: flagellar hook basal-body protein [Parvularculaceae bacterium]|nr:flagellar hook basal-body protein [Parvularculaceae bacterium]HNS86780.1 flagellar hook basal-body protein [Parvularculaceae bacterium]
MSFSGLFSIGLSGLSAFSTGLEAVSSNIANSQTTGYKRVRTDFADLIPSDAHAFGQSVGAGVIGGGVAAVSRQLVGEQGAVTRTNNATDIAVSGDGFFVVSQAPAGNASFLFTRAGDFKADALGNLVNSAGFYLQGAGAGATGGLGSLQSLQTVNINRTPTGADPAALGALAGVEIDADGTVNATYANGETHTIFRIPLALFVNPEGLEDAERSAFRNTTLSGGARLAGAQTGSAGAIEGSALEISTVDIGQEFSTLISTQRAYSTASRVISTADELWRTLVRTAA